MKKLVRDKFSKLSTDLKSYIKQEQYIFKKKINILKHIHISQINLDHRGNTGDGLKALKRINLT